MKERHYVVIKAGLLLSLVSTLLISALSLPHAVVGQQKASSTAPSANAELVMLSVTVSDKKGCCVKGLQQDNFTVLSDKSPQEIKLFSNQAEPVSVTILLDRSGSMSEKRPGINKVGFIKEALSRLMQSGNKASEYLLLGFNQNFRLLLDWTRDPQAVLIELDKLASEPPRGQTALYDACYLGIEKARGGAHARRVLILFTDGEENSSHRSFSELRRLLPTTNIVIYALDTNGLWPLSPSLGPPEGSHFVLAELTSLSGGLVFYPRSKADVEADFESISQELQYQYLIGFKPKDSARDGKRHHITVKVAALPNAPDELKHLSVRSQESYVATKQ